ncbi:MAG: pyridoxal phosphate-dependent aminotransferase [Lachnospiraceae bacterium]|jgi:aspartate aminotransferase|nr:pyridoxal phosphate-dependent aminotransferase [Lachnospiraceae bacterium]
MLNSRYVEMTNHESVIRKIFMYGKERAAQIGYENVFDYSLGNPSVPAPERFNGAIRDILRTQDDMAVHGYSPVLGISEARQAVAASLNRRFGMHYEEKHIFMTAGAAGAVAHALRAVLEEPGDEIIAFAPYFSEYKPYAEGAGGRLVVVPADTDSFQIHFDALERLMGPKVKAVLVNTPNNPSGVVYSEETLLHLAQILQDKQSEYGHSIYLISDEPYRELVFDGVKAPYVASCYANTFTCYSFSKSMSVPGERIGYVAVNPDSEDAGCAVNVFGQISRETGHNCPPSLMQLAVARCISDTSDLSVYEENKTILYRELTAMGFSCVEPGGTFYMFPRSLEPDDKAFCERAKKYDLLLVPGGGFGCPGHFRIAYCIPTEKVIRSLPAFRMLAEEYLG